LGLTERVVAAAEHAGAPARWEVAVEVERLRWARRWDREVVVIVDGAFEEQAVATRTRWRSLGGHGDHQPLVIGMGHPRSIDVRDPHAEHATVAVDVFDVQSRQARGIAPRPWADARQTPRRAVGEHPFGTVGVDAGGDVERAGSKSLDHRWIAGCVAGD